VSLLALLCVSLSDDVSFGAVVPVGLLEMMMVVVVLLLLPSFCVVVEEEEDHEDGDDDCFRSEEQ
jgi:hypothetical protein